MNNSELMNDRNCVSPVEISVRPYEVQLYYSLKMENPDVTTPEDEFSENVNYPVPSYTWQY